MSEPSPDLSDDTLRKTLGELSEADITAIRKDLEGTNLSKDIDLGVDDLLREVASCPAEGEIPSIPDAALELFNAEREKALLEVANEDAELESTIYTQPRRYTDDSEKESFFSRFRLPALGLGLTGLAAAIAVAVVFNGGGGSVVPVTVADSASLLTPGEVTGFTQPVFTWKAGNGGVVDLEVVDAKSGKVVASLDNAFSPVRWSALSSSSSLVSGASYEVRISGGGKALAERSFATVESKDSAPTPAGDLDGIVKQCENLIAQNRPADAWMLWAELNDAQKADPRMQDLKKVILEKITAA